MRIGDREVGADHPPYVIAELGVNHDGSLEKALRLTEAAKKAGADAIKLQLFSANLLMSGAARLAAYQAQSGETDPLDMLRRLEMPLEQMAEVVARAQWLGLHAIVTIFSVDLVEAANALPWAAYKTASPDLIHRPLIECLLATGKPLIISTGAATLQEVARTLTWVHSARERVALLQCVSSYPTPMADSAVGGMLALADIFPGAVGYSDHTTETVTGAVVTAMSGCILEKHLTLERSSAGPDHAASLDPAMFAEYVKLARRGYEQRRHLKKDHPPQDYAKFLSGAESLSTGRKPFDRVKQVLAIEEDVRNASRQSVVARHAMKSGDVVSVADVTFKRPGTGIEPFRVAELLGRRVTRDIEADTPLTWEDVGGEP